MLQKMSGSLTALYFFWMMRFQLLQQLGPDSFEEIEIILFPVVRIRMGQRLPATFLKNQGDFGVHLISDIYTMRIVLCCGQNQFGRRDKAGIQIDRSRQRDAQSFGQFLLQLVCPELDFRQLSRVDEPLDANELSQYAWASFVFIVVGFLKRPDLTYEIGPAKLVCHAIRRGV